MQILNFGHPLSAAQLSQLALHIDKQPVSRIVDMKCQLDNNAPFVPQIRALVDGIGWLPEHWQQTPFVVVPPGLAAAAAILIAEIHGRCGYFPSIVRMRPVGGPPPVFKVAEVVGLDRVREDSRKKR